MERVKWSLTKEVAKAVIFEHIHENMADHGFEEELYDQDVMLNVKRRDVLVKGEYEDHEYDFADVLDCASRRRGNRPILCNCCKE